MTHGLAQFRASELVGKARSALELMEASPDGDAGFDAIHEALRIALENQMMIAETLDLIKKEFDKFEAGLDKIL